MIEINLLPPELKVKVKEKKPEIEIKPGKLLYLIPVLAAVLVCLHLYLLIANLIKGNQYASLDSKWKQLEPQRKILDSYNIESASMSESARLIQQLTEQRINWPEKLNKLSLHLPSGLWLNQLSGNAKELIIDASAVSLEKEEMGLIAKLSGSLKNDAVFFKGMNNLELGPVKHRPLGSYDIADFTLTGTFKSK